MKNFLFGLVFGLILVIGGSVAYLKFSPMSFFSTFQAFVVTSSNYSSLSNIDDNNSIDINFLSAKYAEEVFIPCYNKHSWLSSYAGMLVSGFDVTIRPNADACKNGYFDKEFAYLDEYQKNLNPEMKMNTTDEVRGSMIEPVVSISFEKYMPQPEVLIDGSGNILSGVAVSDEMKNTLLSGNTLSGSIAK